MKKEITELERKINSNTEWRTSTDIWIIEQFEMLGFKRPKDFMKVRFYDFFNLDRVDNNRAEEMLLALLDFLYPDREDDPDYEEQHDERKYIRKWIKEHEGKTDGVKIGDVLCDENLSRDGFLSVFDHITRCFYKSDEYDSRRYRYGSLKEIPVSKRR